MFFLAQMYNNNSSSSLKKAFQGTVSQHRSLVAGRTALRNKSLDRSKPFVQNLKYVSD